MLEVFIENLFLIPIFSSECGLGIFFYHHFHDILTWISLHVWSGFFGSTCVMPGFDIWNYKSCLGQPSFSLNFACSQLNQAIIKQVFVNLLGPSDAIWRQKIGSTLAQVKACCLTAPSHYLNQCWFTISKVHWHSFEYNFTRDTSATNH